MGLTIQKLLTFTILILIFVAWGQWGLGELLAKVSDAPEVTAAQIRALQNDQESKDRFVVVDVRSKAETDVSVIPGALTKTEFERTIDLSLIHI